MEKIRLRDWWWLRTDTRCRYVCPFLMTLSLYLWRLRGKRVHWYISGNDIMCLMEGKRSMWEMPCLFPKWAILAECRYRNWQIQRKYRATVAKGK